MSIERVFWTDAEWQRLAELFHSLRMNNPFETYGTLIAKALQQFPEERRRRCDGAYATTIKEKLEPLVLQVNRQLTEQARSAQSLQDRQRTLEKQPVDLEAALAQLTPAKLLERLGAVEVDGEFAKALTERFGGLILDELTPSQVTDHFSADELLESVETPDLVAAATRRVVSDLLAGIPISVVHQVQAQVTPTMSYSPPSPATVSDALRKKKIVIVGAYGPQIQTINLACRALPVEVVHVKQEAIGNLPQQLDHCILWTKFISHKHTDYVKQRVPANKLTLHSKGVTELIRLIERLCGVV